MGDQNTKNISNLQEQLVYLDHLLEDINSLQYLVENNLIETGIIRIGAEQEFCLLDSEWAPSSNAIEVLEDIEDPHFTTEIALFNLELNVDPFVLEKDAFRKVKNQLVSLMEKAEKAAKKNNDKIVLVGILPTLTWNELSLDFMTPKPRYFALNDALKASRGGEFRMHFSGTDELSIKNNTIMFEACNTSFQMHLQIEPDDFESSYNWAQLIAAPVLGISTNSPLLFGKELWSETRIALFQQSIDTRKYKNAQINQQARVSFGEDWVKGGIVDFYKKEISKYKILINKDIEKGSKQVIEEGGIPKLEALSLFNGTIYKWNRICYGVGGGKPHIRIENRYIPSGPSIDDEMATFVFWVGLMKGRQKKHEKLYDAMDFGDVRSNFIKSARYGKDTLLQWFDKKISVSDLVLNELLPIAQEGLTKMKVDEQDIEFYLDIIKKRVKNNSGSEWIVKNYRALRKHYKQHASLTELTKSMYKHQKNNEVVSEWQDIDIPKSNKWASQVGHIMSNILIKADPSDSAHLTLAFMQWNNIHHLPVATTDYKLKGIITQNHIESYWNKLITDHTPLSAEDIMVDEAIAVDIKTPISKAISIMEENAIGCLPILQNDYLVGIVTLKDLEAYYT